MPAAPTRHDLFLTVQLLGAVDFPAWLAQQRRLVYDVSGDRTRAALVLCEHPPLISVGRQGSRDDVHFDPSELQTRGWPVRWVNRGGGCLLHLPGQLAIYPVLPLDRLGLDLHGYLDALQGVLIDVAADAGVTAGPLAGAAGVAVKGRLLAHVGVAARDWVTYYGAALNINPDLELFRRIHCGGDGPMTSLERERRLAVNPALVRQRVVERFLERFGIERVSVLHGANAPTPVPTYDTRDALIRWFESL